MVILKMITDLYECMECEAIYHDYPEFGRCTICDGRVTLVDKNYSNDWDDYDN